MTAAVTTDMTTTATSWQRLICLLARDSGLLEVVQGAGMQNIHVVRCTGVLPIRHLRFHTALRANIATLAPEERQLAMAHQR